MATAAAAKGGVKESVFTWEGKDKAGKVIRGEVRAAGGNVVMLANSPRRIPGGRTVPLADFTDVYPTLCELASVPLPAGVALAMPSPPP